MKAGNIFTIEPMINEGGWKCDTWKDDWTVVTLDGKRSAQFEHTILITEDGCEVLKHMEEIDESRYQSYADFVAEAIEYKEHIKYNGTKKETSQKFKNNKQQR